MTRPRARRWVLVLMLAGCSLEVDHTRTEITIGETSVLDGTDPNNGDVLVANHVTLDRPAVLQSLSINVKSVGSPAGFLTMALYDSAGTEPGDLMATTGSVVAAVGWNSAPVTAPLSLPAGNYWLVVTFSLDFIVPAYTASSGTEHWVDRAYGPMPATFPAGSFSGTGHYSFYATLHP